MAKNFTDIVLQFLNRYHRIILFVFIPLLSLAMHFKIFTWDIQGTHAWRQTETQTMIRNFAEEDFNILNPRVNNNGDGNDIFRMEFPLMQWIYAVFFKIFGDHIIISRILTWLTGLFCIFGFYRLCYGFTRSPVASLLCTWAFTMAPTFFFYTMNPMPDIMAFCFSIWGLVFFFRWVRHRQWKDIILSIIFFTLGTLVKLPFIIYFSLIGGYEIIRLFRTRFQNVKEMLLVAILSLAILSPALAWYIWVIPTWTGNGIVQGLLALKASQVPELLSILWYNLTQVFPKLLLNLYTLPLFILGVYFIFRKRYYKRPLFPLFLIWALAVIAYYLFEANMIDRWHDYYLFPFVPEIFLIVLYAIHQLLQGKRFIGLALVLILCILMPFQTAHYSYGRWKIGAENHEDIGFVKYKKELRNAVPDTSLVIVANDISPFIYLYHIHKKGWAVMNYWMWGDTLANRIKHGARYFYCDSRRLDEDPGIRKHLDHLIMQRDSIKVWALKTE